MASSSSSSSAPSYGLSPEEKLSMAQGRYRTLDNRRYSLHLQNDFPEPGQISGDPNGEAASLDKAMEDLQKEIDGLQSQISGSSSSSSSSS